MYLKQLYIFHCHICYRIFYRRYTVWQIYLLSDNLVSVSSTTAVSIGSQIMHMLTVMLVGLAMGATVMIGRCIGAKDCKKASEAIGNTVTMFMGIALVLMVVLIAAVRPIVSVMSTPAEAVEGTIRYLTICFIGIPFITAYNIISAIFRGIGDSKSPMYFIAIACVANIGLDYLFIGAMGLDAAGAALGTTIAQAISVIIALSVIVKRGTGIKMVKSDFRPKSIHDEEYFKSRCSGCIAGWIYTDILYYNYHICQSAWIK